MAYNQFNLPKVQADFGITVETTPDLFASVASFRAPLRIRDSLPDYIRLATTNNTEAARTFFLIAPILGEVWHAANYRIALFSGTRFDVDESVGLTGVCDFILGLPPQLNYVTAPVVMIVEAKNEDIWGGVGQCAAAMVAAQRFNSQKNPSITTIYGAVTDGGSWRFMRLREKTLVIDLTEISISEVEKILGILLCICGIVPERAKAA